MRFRITDLQEILGMLKYRGNKELLVKYIREQEAYFRNVDEDTYHAIREFLHSEEILIKEAVKIGSFFFIIIKNYF